MVDSYSIVWKQFDRLSPEGIRLEAKKSFGLPYFIDYEDKKKFEAGERIDLGDLHLVQGILIAYDNQSPLVDTHYSRMLFPRVMSDLKQIFRYKSMERLIVDISSFIRKKNGEQLSLKSLLSGTEILPNSSKVKFDCCVDLYNLLERNEYENRFNGLIMLKNLLIQIDKRQIDNKFLMHIETFQDFLEDRLN